MVAKKHDVFQLWHRRLGHISENILNKLLRLNLVKGLPETKMNKQASLCESCIQGKQTKNSFKSSAPIIRTRPFKLLHVNLFGPTKTLSLSGCRFSLVIVDDLSRFTWVYFLSHKSETFKKI